MQPLHYREVVNCRACGNSRLESVLSLGNMYVSDFLDTPNNDVGMSAPLELVLCSSREGGCDLLQLKHTVSSENMFRNYWYRSGINQSMVRELADIVNSATSKVDLEDGDYVIDIGANDGTLLRCYENSAIKRIGFEPALNLMEFNKKGTTNIIPDFFSWDSWSALYGEEKAKLITAIGMFYDLDQPNAFVSDINKCLHNDGVFIIQMMYLPLFLEKNAFDGICHEHLEYYSLTALSNLLSKHDLEVVDVEIRANVNEGSARFFITKKFNSINNKFAEGRARVDSLLQKEKEMGLKGRFVYEQMVMRFDLAKKQATDYISQAVLNGKRIHGYAASTKGNTTLQYYGLTPDLIEAIADCNPDKWGKYTVGTCIPVISEEESRQLVPDYYFVLAWHFLDGFIERERDFLDRGGKFIVPMPEFRVIGKEDLI